LVFFHFSGIVPKNPVSISKHQTRYSLLNRPELSPLFTLYHRVLIKKGYERYKEKKYWFGYLPDTDINIPLFLRNFWQEIARAGIHPSDPAHIPIIIQFANEPVLGEPIVSRLWLEIYRQRPDVQAAFPNIETNKESRDAFVNWVMLHGRYEYNLHDVFVELEK